MSLSFNGYNITSQSYFKLVIHQSQICKNIKVPIPYGLSIIFDDFPVKCIEPIKNENVILKSPQNEIIYNLNNNNLSKKELIEKEFIINSYTTSIFFLKKNFASVKIPILYRDNNSQKQWFFLKDINENICIKILISIEIHLTNEIFDNFNLNNEYNILKQNVETIKENRINKNFNYIKAMNHHKKKIKNKNSINNHNTYMLSTNYNSSLGKSLLNITNNIYMKTTNNNSNNINNLNITFPLNFSSLTFFGENNSFFLDTIGQKENNSNSIIQNKNSIKSLNENNEVINKERLRLISENDLDSITIKDNDIYSDDLSNNEMLDKNDNILDKINKILSVKNDGFLRRQNDYSINYNNYLKDKKNLAQKGRIMEKENENIKNNLKIIEKSKQIYENKTLNLNESLMNFSKSLYRENIQNELDEFDKVVMTNINNISCDLNNIGIMMNFKQTKNKINNNKNNIDKIFINKNNNSNQNNSSHKISILNEFNKSHSSLSNSEYINEDNNKIIKNKIIKSYKNKNRIIDNNFKKCDTKKNCNLFLDFSDILNKKDSKKKSSKSNITKEKLKMKISFNKNSVNNFETKYLITKSNYNKETLVLNLINNSSNNIPNKNKILKRNNNKTIKKLPNLNTKKLKNDKYLFKNKYFENNYKKCNTSTNKKIISLENQSLNGTINSKRSISTEKNNNLYKKKLAQKENINYNKKNFNNETFRKLSNNSNFKGKLNFIYNNINSLGNDSLKKSVFTEKESILKANDNKNPSNKIIRRKTKNKTVKINLNININRSSKKKTKFRNSLKLPEDEILLNLEKQNKSREDTKKTIYAMRI